jgi:hypothetical protein
MSKTTTRRWLGAHTRMRLAALGTATGAVAAMGAGVASTPAVARTCTAAPCEDAPGEYWTPYGITGIPEANVVGASMFSDWQQHSFAPAHAAGDTLRMYLYVEVGSPYGSFPTPAPAPPARNASSWAEVGSALGGPLNDASTTTVTTPTPYKRDKAISGSAIEVLYPAATLGSASIGLHNASSTCYDIYINGSLQTCLGGLFDVNHAHITRMEVGLVGHSSTNYKSQAKIHPYAEYRGSFGTWNDWVPDRGAPDPWIPTYDSTASTCAVPDSTIPAQVDLGSDPGLC